MASLLEHVSLNKLTDQLGKAIEEVGGDISCVEGPFDYPQVIRDQLSAGASSGGSLEEGNGITITKNGANYVISANAGAVLTRDLNPSHNVDEDVNVDTIPAGTSIQEALEIIMNDVFPTLPSLLKGDIIVASEDGRDEYQHPYFSGTGIKSGLVEGVYYIRMFIASRKEPIYISCEPLGGLGDLDNLPFYTESEAKILFNDIFEK